MSQSRDNVNDTDDVDRQSGPGGPRSKDDGRTSPRDRRERKKVLNVFESNLKSLFEYLDVDGSGDLDKDEFERAFFHLELHFRTKEIDRLFRKFAGDDGTTIDFDSFRNVLKYLHGKGARKSKSSTKDSSKKKYGLTTKKLVKILKDSGRSLSHVWPSSSKVASNNQNVPDVREPSENVVQNKDQLRMMFNHIDRDRSGDLSRQEMITTLRHIGLYRSERQIDRLFEHFTGSRDGPIDFKRFCEIIEHQLIAERSDTIEKRFSLRKLGRRVSRSLSDIRNVPTLEKTKFVVNALTTLAILATIWETLFMVCMYNSEYEPSASAFALDIVVVVICAVRKYLDLYRTTRTGKVVPSSDMDDAEEEIEGESTERIERKIRTHQSLHIMSSSIRQFDREYVTFGLSLVPLDMLFHVAGTPWSVLFRANRLIRIVRLPFLLQDMGVFLSSVDYLPPLKFRMSVYLFFALVFLAHLHACVFYVIAVDESRDGVQETWASQDGLWEMNETSTTYTGHVTHRYARSLYWAIVTLLTVGLGDVVPVPSSKTEMGFTVWTMYTGAAISCAIVGCIVHAFSSTDSRTALCRQRQEGISAYMRSRQLPITLQRRVLEWVKNVDSVLQGVKDDTIKTYIPPPLHRAMVREKMNALLGSLDALRFVKRVKGPGLNGARDTDLFHVVRNEIADSLSQVSQVFLPGELILGAGRAITGLQVIAHGLAHVYRVGNETSVVAKYTTGDVIEEEAVWRSLWGERSYTIRDNVRAKMYCTIYYLSNERFKQCLCHHLWPLQLKQLQTFVNEHFDVKKKVKDVLLRVTSVTSFDANYAMISSWRIPGSMFRDMWCILSFVAVLLQMILFPLQLIEVYPVDSWPRRFTSTIFAISFATDVFFMVDIVLQAQLLPFMYDGILIADRSAIWNKYRRTHFMYDVISVIPARYVALLLGCSPCTFFVLSLNRPLRWMHTVRYANAASSVIQERTMFDVSIKYRRFVQLYLLLLLLLHWAGCVWIFVGHWSTEQMGAEQSWMSIDRENPIQRMSDNVAGSITQYLRATYFVAVAVSTVGYGDIRAVNTEETWTAIFILFVVGYVYPALIGCIASLISSDDDARAASNQHAENIGVLTNSIGANQNLRLRMTHYLDFLNESGRECAGSESRILNNLPMGLRMDVQSHVHELRKTRSTSTTSFVTWRLFNDGSNMSRWMLAKLCPKIYLPGDNVLVRGETFDEVYMVDQGALCMHHADTGKHIALFGVGHAFGEYALIRRQTQHDTLWSVTFSTCMVLSRDDFRAVLREFPERGRKLVAEIGKRHVNVLNTNTKEAERAVSRRYQSQRSTPIEMVVRRLTTSERAYIRQFVPDNQRSLTSQSFGRDLQRRIKSDCDQITLQSFRHPLSRNSHRTAWDMLVFCGLSYEFVMLPLYLCFDKSSFGVASDILDASFDMIYIVNAVLSVSFFATLKYGLVVWNVRALATSRVRTLDGARQLLSAVPWYWIIISMTASSATRTVGHCLRLLRLPDMVSKWRRLDRVYASSSTMTSTTERSLEKLFKVLQIFACVLFFAHYAGTALYSLANVEFVTSCDTNVTSDVLGLCEWNGTWISKQVQERHLPEDGGDEFMWYSRAFYWAVSTMVVVVIGDVTPVNVQETIYVLVTILIGVVINAIIIGNLISLMSIENTSYGKFRRHAYVIRRYMECNKLPDSIKERVIDVMAYRWETSREEQCLRDLKRDKLPRSLRIALKRHIGGKLVLSCPIFSALVTAQIDANREARSGKVASTAPTSAIKRLLLSIEYKVFAPGDVIFHAHDRAQIMYIVRSGRVQMCMSEMDGYLKTHQIEIPSKSFLGRGCYFGEISLSTGSFSYGYQAVASSFVDVCVIRRSEFIKAFQDSPQLHVDICCRINAWNGWQWLEQLNPDAASVMSQAASLEDNVDANDRRRGSGSPVKSSPSSGYALGRYNKASRRRSTSATLDLSQLVGTTASVGCSFEMSDESDDNSDDEAKAGWIYENTSTGRVIRKVSSRRVPHELKANRVLHRMDSTRDRRILVSKTAKALDLRRDSIWYKPLWQRAWEIMASVAMLYTILSTSYRAVVSTSTRGAATMVFDTIVDVFFMLDVYVRATRIWIVYRGELLRERRRIFAQYMTHWRCILDIVLAIPLALLFRICTIGSSPSYTVEVLLRLPQLARCLILHVHVENTRQLLEPHVGSATMGLLIVLALWVLSNHFCACIWVALHRYVAHRDELTWAIAENLCDEDDHESCVGGLSNVYYHAYYFVVTCTSTVGYGDVRPYTTAETWFNTFVCLLGSIFFSFIIGSFQSIFMMLSDVGVSAFSRAQSDVQNYMTFHNISPHLRRTITEHGISHWLQNKVVGSDAIVEHLPDTLKQAIASHVYDDVLSSVSFMRFWTSDLKARLSQHVRSVYFCARDKIYSRMDKGEHLYIVASGRVNFVLCTRLRKDRTEESLADEDAYQCLNVLERQTSRRGNLHKETFVLGKGDFFGESAIVGILENRYDRGLRNHSATALTACQLLYIDASTMQDVLSVVPIQQRTFVLQQMSLSTSHRLKATGGTAWLRQCLSAYITGSNTRGEQKRASREIQKKGTGTIVINNLSFQKKPLVMRSKPLIRKQRRASFSGVMRTLDEWRAMRDAKGREDEDAAMRGESLTPSPKRQVSPSPTMTSSTIRAIRRNRRASFSSISRPSLIASQRGELDSGGLISRSLSFLRDHSTGLARSMSFASVASFASVTSVASEASDSSRASTLSHSSFFTPIVTSLLGHESPSSNATSAADSSGFESD